MTSRVIRLDSPELEMQRALRASVDALEGCNGPEVMRSFYRHLRAGAAPREAARLARIEHGKATARDRR